MAIEQDEDQLDTSASMQTEEPAQPALDDAAGSEGSDETTPPGGGEEQASQTPDKATPGAKQPKSSDEPKSRIEQAIDHLSGKEKRDRQKESAATEKAAAAKDGAKAPAKPAAKKPDDQASKDALTAEDLKQPEHNRKRIGELLQDRKQFRAEAEKHRVAFEEAQPLIEKGKAFAEVTKQFGLDADLSVLEDEDVAGAVIFQASLRRIHQGTATDADRKTAEEMFQALDATRAALGLGQAAPRADVEAFEQALAKADRELDFDDLRKLVAGLKTAEKPANKQQAPPAAQQQPVQRQPVQRQPEAAPADPTAAPDYRLYQQRAAQRMRADGIAEPVKYFTDQVFPRVLQELKAAYGAENPAQVWNRLSPQARHDVSISAHEFIQKQAKALKPAPVKPAPEGRPVRAGGTAPAWAKTGSAPTKSAAAVDFLSGS